MEFSNRFFHGMVHLHGAVMTACVAYDTVFNRRQRPAFDSGLVLIVLSHPLRLLMAGSEWWMSFTCG